MPRIPYLTWCALEAFPRGLYAVLFLATQVPVARHSTIPSLIVVCLEC